MRKHAVKKLLYLLRQVPNQQKTQQMSNKAFIENGGTLKFPPECYKKSKNV